MIEQGRIICDGCKKELDYVLVNGYPFGDRLMEGVMFKVCLSKNKWICIGVEEEAKEYIKQFNWKYWKSICESFCNENDLAHCPLCGEEEVLVE